MLKSELERIQRLAKKNRERAERELANEKNNPRNQEKKRLRKDDDAAGANKLFREMKIREF